MPYTRGARYWLNHPDHGQALLAVVAEVSDHELVLVDVRVAPDGPVVYPRLIVGRAAVREARPFETDAVGADGTKTPGGRRVTVKG